MGKGDYLGEFEQVVLLAIMALAENAYGVTIRREIEARTGRSVTLGSIYPTLQRLEDKGLVDSRMSEPTGTRGGRSKRHFTVSPDGQVALERSRDMLEAMWRGAREAES